MFSLNYPDGWSLLEAMDSGSHCLEDEQRPGVGFPGERCMCSGDCGDVKAVEDLRAGGTAWRSSLNHYCTHVSVPCPQLYLQSGVYINQVSHRFQMAEIQV